MYEKLDKLRAEVERCKNRIEDDKAKLKLAEQKLQEAEHTQILADVGALHLSPEQLAEFLKLAASGNLLNAGTSVGNIDRIADKEPEDEDFDDLDFDESEDTEDEEN